MGVSVSKRAGIGLSVVGARASATDDVGAFAPRGTGSLQGLAQCRKVALGILLRRRGRGFDPTAVAIGGSLTTTMRARRSYHQPPQSGRLHKNLWEIYGVFRQP